MKAIIEADTSDIQRKLGNLEKKKNLVLARASNRAAVTGRKVLAQETAKRYNVRQKDVKDIVNVKKACYGDPKVTLTYKDTHKNLILWKKAGVVKPRRVISFDVNGKPNVKVYRANVKVDTGERALGGDRKPFIQITKKGNIGMFRRTVRRRVWRRGGGRELEHVMGPALPQVIKSKEVMDKFRASTALTLNQRIEHEIEWVLKGR